MSTRVGTPYKPSKADYDLWKWMAQVEPELEEILEDVMKVAREDKMAPPKIFCANAYWYGRRGFRRRMSNLVGWGASSDTNPQLRSSKAYDAAYNVLYSRLPDCRHDEGMCWSEPPEKTDLKFHDAADLLAMDSDKLTAHSRATLCAEDLVEYLSDLDDMCAPAPKPETLDLYKKVRRTLAKLNRAIEALDHNLLTP